MDIGDQTLQHGLVQPARVRLARDLRGWTQQQVIDRMPQPITTAALSQIESGKVRPSPDTLEGLGKALDVPLGFLHAHWPGSDDDPWPPRTYFRDLRATPPRERRRATALASLLRDLLVAVEHVVHLPEVSLPSCPVPRDASRDEVEEAANVVREAWQLGSEPIPQVVRTIEQHGIPVARLLFGTQDVDAFSISFDGRPLVILTQDKCSYVRSRFDAAHELGHLVMHQDATANDRVTEGQAHDFASVFLMPREAALRELPRTVNATTWPRLAQLKAKWGMSMAALLYRANSLGILDPDRYRSAMKFMSMKGWRTNEPGDRELGPAEPPSLIKRALEAIEAETGRTVGQFIEDCHLPIRDTLPLVTTTTDRRPALRL